MVKEKWSAMVGFLAIFLAKGGWGWERSLPKTGIITKVPGSERKTFAKPEAQSFCGLFLHASSAQSEL
eukprot:scaffold642_cov73-Cylindrotheca_fusiformis.AAC.1